MRRWPSTKVEHVHQFTRANPADPRATLLGLISGFREHAEYDLHRYAAGSIQYNLPFGSVDLQTPLRGQVSFESMLASDKDQRLLCYDFTPPVD